MAPPLYRPARLRGTFFRGSDAVAAKLLTPDQLRSRAWRPLFRDAGSTRLTAVHPSSYVSRTAASTPPESRTRVQLALAGFPPPVSQYALYANGEFVVRFDLAWPRARVAVEYDGLWHADARQLSADRERLNRIDRAGWTVVFITNAQLRNPHRFAAFCDHLRHALAQGIAG